VLAVAVLVPPKVVFCQYTVPPVPPDVVITPLPHIWAAPLTVTGVGIGFMVSLMAELWARTVSVFIVPLQGSVNTPLFAPMLKVLCPMAAAFTIVSEFAAWHVPMAGLVHVPVGVP
jgi:hypothetical protein